MTDDELDAECEAVVKAELAPRPVDGNGPFYSSSGPLDRLFWRRIRRLEERLKGYTTEDPTPTLRPPEALEDSGGPVMGRVTRIELLNTCGLAGALSLRVNVDNWVPVWRLVDKRVRIEVIDE